MYSISDSVSDWGLQRLFPSGRLAHSRCHPQCCRKAEMLLFQGRFSADRERRSVAWSVSTVTRVQVWNFLSLRHPKDWEITRECHKVGSNLVQAICNGNKERNACQQDITAQDQRYRARSRVDRRNAETISNSDSSWLVMVIPTNISLVYSVRHAEHFSRQHHDRLETFVG